MTLLLRLEKKMVIYLGLVLLTSGLRFKPRQHMKCGFAHEPPPIFYWERLLLHCTNFPLFLLCSAY